jgi:hypothetical protein
MQLLIDLLLNPPIWYIFSFKNTLESTAAMMNQILNGADTVATSCLYFLLNDTSVFRGKENILKLCGSKIISAIIY